MLHSYLFGAIKDLEQLISLTKQDIEDAKIAKHEEIFLRNEQKLPLINSFENKKDLAQQEIVLLKNKHKNAKISEILDEETNQMLSKMRQSLSDLKDLNATYGRIVLNVSEFYSSLLDAIFPHDDYDYGPFGTIKSNRTKSTFLYQQA